jgi:2-dehydropantoate 2-reductase
MKFAVMGAGAVGCFYGGMLARAGHEVTLIGRQNHVAAIRRDGLRLESLAFDEFIEVTACTDASGVAGADAVLLRQVTRYGSGSGCNDALPFAVCRDRHTAEWCR